MFLCFNCGKKLTNKQTNFLAGKYHTFTHGKTIEYGGARPACDKCVEELIRRQNARGE